MKDYYSMEIAGLTRRLPLFPVSDSLKIAAFILFGDAEITVACAREIIKIMPEHDIVVTAEAKSIPLIHEIARQNGEKKYVVARKGVKVYMRDPLGVEVNSITTQKTQHLYIGQDDVDLIKGKRVVILDDVISTGESLNALEHLVNSAGGEIVAKIAVLAEGDAAKRKDIKFLEPLPLFDSEGEPIK